MSVVSGEVRGAVADVTRVKLPGQAYRRYALSLLMLIYVLNFVDRQMVSILAEPIKRDLHLADWQLGLMSGLAFSLFYAVAGIPVARLAERSDRVFIISAALAVWSLFTAGCGLAQSFVSLLLARVGVGAGEAGCMPPSLSLISDMVAKEDRASAISFYMLGGPLGSLLGLAFGGLLADAYGWRVAFVLVGLPGLLVAAIAAVSLREPRRGHSPVTKSATPTWRLALSELAGIRTYWMVVAAITLKTFISYGMLAFTASFFFRNFSAELGEISSRVGMKSVGLIGLGLGVTSGVMAILGLCLGGYLTDRYAARDLRAYVVIPAIGVIVGLPFTMAALTTDSLPFAFAMLLAPGLLNALWIGPAYAVVQGLVRPDMRATATAVLLLAINLIGLGLGPLGVGIVSDLLSAKAGYSDGDSIRFSMLFFSLLTIPCALLFWSARTTLREEFVS